MIDTKLLLLGVIIGIVVIVTLPLAESAIPPTRAVDRITTSNGTVFAFNSSANVNFVGTGSATVTGSNNSKTVYVNVVAGGSGITEANGTNIGTGEASVYAGNEDAETLQFKKLRAGTNIILTNYTDNILINATGGGATQLNDLTDVTLTAPAYNHILQFLSGQWINKLFAINTQSPANDVFVTGINNQTGAITTNQFSVNTITCSGTDKVSAINNVTGQVTCSTDATGGAGADKVGMAMVASVDLSFAKSNIGTSYVDVYSTAFQPSVHLINFTGYTHVKSLMYYDYVGAGTQQCRWTQVSNNNNVLLETATFTADQDPQINGWIALPAWTNNAETTVEWQCKSTTGTDDPIPKGFRLYLRNSN